MILLLFIIPALAGLAAFALHSPAIDRGNAADTDEVDRHTIGLHVIQRRQHTIS